MLNRLLRAGLSNDQFVLTIGQSREQPRLRRNDLAPALRFEVRP